MPSGRVSDVSDRPPSEVEKASKTCGANVQCTIDRFNARPFRNLLEQSWKDSNDPILGRHYIAHPSSPLGNKALPRESLREHTPSDVRIPERDGSISR